MSVPAVINQQGRAVAVRNELTIEELTSQVATIQKAMDAVMKADEHYGVIPGTQKPTLLKAGAEKLLLLFRLDPEYVVEKDWQGEHLTVTAHCTLWHIPTQDRIASGVAMCSTRESKYAWRKSERTCPKCGQAAIIKGKQEYGGGWLCFKKKGGCGSKWPDGATEIESQETGRVPNDDLPDTYNTVVKMGCKRALIAAVLNGTAASDIFTQDLEDLPTAEGESEDKDRASQEPAETTRPQAPPPRDNDDPPATSGSPSAGEANPFHEEETHLTITENQIVEGEVAGITDPQKRKIYAAIHNLERAKVLSEERVRKGMVEHYGTEHTSELTKDQASDLIERLGALEKAVAEQEERDNAA